MKTRRTAVCECGVELGGESEADLLSAAQDHIARVHPDLLLGRNVSSRGTGHEDRRYGDPLDAV